MRRLYLILIIAIVAVMLAYRCLPHFDPFV